MNIVMCYSSDLGGRRTGIADKFHSKATLFDDWRQILMSSMSLFTECTTRATAKPEVINLISEQQHKTEEHDRNITGRTAGIFLLYALLTSRACVSSY